MTKVQEERGGRAVFQSQFEAVERATPRERIGSGKISPMRICEHSISTCCDTSLHEALVSGLLTHAPGPHVDAKKKIKMAMKAIWALTAEMLLAIDLPEGSICV